MPTQPYNLKDGTAVPGTTTVISASLGWGKQRLIGWAYKQGKDGKPMRAQVEEAQNAGTLAHAMVEHHVKCLDRPSVDKYDASVIQKAEKAFQAFHRWERTSNLRIMFAEIPLVSEALKYGGCIDGIGEMDEGLALIDFKTSNHTYADHIIQVAAYANLWEENHPDQPLTGGIHILRFGKEEANFAHYSMERETVLGRPLRTFVLLRELYDLQKPVEALA